MAADVKESGPRPIAARVVSLGEYCDREEKSTWPLHSALAPHGIWAHETHFDEDVLDWKPGGSGGLVNIWSSLKVIAIPPSGGCSWHLSVTT